MPRHPSPPIYVDFNHLGTAYAVLSYQIPQNPILLELTPAELEVLGPLARRRKRGRSLRPPGLCGPHRQ